jgi:hypothetical protein
MSAIRERWMGDPLAAALEVLEALLDEAFAADDAAVVEELLLDELPHPLAMSAAIANDSDTAFSLMSPLLG